MTTVELVEQALEAAQRLGYQIRHEWLDGVSTGACLIRGQKWLFLDLADSAEERLAIVRGVLARESGLASLPLSSELAAALEARPAA